MISMVKLLNKPTHCEGCGTKRDTRLFRQRKICDWCVNDWKRLDFLVGRETEFSEFCFPSDKLCEKFLRR